MILGFVIIIGGLGALMILERIFPDQELVYVPGWWARVLTINFSQLVIVVLGMYTWERWLQVPSLFHLGEHVGPAMGGFLAYLINTWIFYWWHRARHEIYPFWVIFHQMHHSAQRIETITSFYKHPLEILADSILMTILIYPILGLSMESSIWLSGFSAFGEYFYHMNIRTPQWIGYLLQRPESHRIHHYRNKRVSCDNYSDCPLWDMLGDTFSNPEIVNVPTGFQTQNEIRFWDMIFCRDVLRTTGDNIHWDTIKRRLYTLGGLILLAIGCLQPTGYLFNLPQLRGLGIVSVASPLPLVFSSYNGVETFSTSFSIKLTTINNQTIELPLDSELYAQIKGPYNRRNIYGVVFSHGPFFDRSELIQLRDQILKFGVCQVGPTVKYRGRSAIPRRVEVTITSNTQQQQSSWTLTIDCLSETD